MRKTLLSILGGALLLPLSAQSIRTNPEFQQYSIPANDDGSSELVTLPFTVNFFGRIRTAAYVNNNGNITFDQALPTYTPFGLDGVHREIIAPFFADVDTRAKGSKLVTYGTSKVGTHAAFGVNYVNVGYYNSHSDKVNSFQLVLIERSDTGAGNFDIEFNYDKITWETGDASGGTSGYGGVSASVGWSNGSGDPGTSWQMAGSLIPGSFLDGAPRALAGTHYSSATVGRFVFRARGGMLIPALSLDTGCPVPNASVGAHYQYTLTASGETPPYTWTMLPDPGMTIPFSVSTSGILSGDPKDVGTYNFTLQVSAKADDTTVTAARRCSVTVDPPKLSIRAACPLPQASAGANYSQKFSVAGGTAPYTWLSDRAIPGMTLSSDGTLAGTPSTPGTYPFILTVTSSDTGASPAGLQCSLTVAPSAPVPTISGCPAPDATRGVPYSQTVGASGGARPYVWSLDGGQLPRGLGFTSGVLSGIPDASGPYAFRLRALDARGQSATQDCSVTVSEPAVKQLTSCPLPNAAIGRAYSQQLSAGGGSAPYAWTISGSLPTGLQLSSNGVISGTPTSAGPSLFRLIATDAKGLAVGSQCSISVTRPALSIDSCPMRPGLVGQDYVQDLTAVGGASPYLWTVDGALPPGLSFSTYGRITGKPTAAGDYRFTLRTVDAGGQSVSEACSVSIDPPLPRVTTACPLPAGEVGKAYTASISAQGGTPPYRWFADGALPPDLSLSPTGTLSGVPSKIGTYSFSLLGADAKNRALAQTCSVSIALPEVPTLRTSDVPATVAPATSNIATGVELSDVYSLPLQGTATLTVTPQTGSDAEVNLADPMVRFLNNDRTIRFSIPAGTKKLAIPILSSGTVASSITFAVTSVEVAGNKLPQLPSAKVITVAPAAPTMTSACFTTPTGGIALTVTGYSTTRAVDSATVTIDGKVVTQGTKTSSFDYFGSDLSIRTGGAFTLTLPTIATTTAPSTVSVVLNNAAGSSTSRTASRCQ